MKILRGVEMKLLIKPYAITLHCGTHRNCLHCLFAHTHFVQNNGDVKVGN